MEGHRPCSDLDSIDDQEQIEERFKSGQFSEIEHSLMNQAIHKCWCGKYDSVDAVLQDLECVHKHPMMGGDKEE